MKECSRDLLKVVSVHDRLVSSMLYDILVDVLQDAGAHDGLQAPSHVPEFVSVQITSLTLIDPCTEGSEEVHSREPGPRYCRIKKSRQRGRDG